MRGNGLASLLIGIFSFSIFSACASRPSSTPPPPPPPGPSAAPPPPATPPPAAETAPVVPETAAESAAIPAPGAPSSPITSGPAREILRLRQVGYSEDFLLNKVRHDDENYHLSTDDLIALRQAGLSETLVDAMVRSGGGGFSSSPSSPVPAARHAEFDGIVRQKHGFLGIGGSKYKGIGKLLVDSDKVNWYEANDPEENFSLYQKNIKEMWLNCAPRAGENLCLELCFKTYAGDEWCYRDAGWVNGENRQVSAFFDYFQKAFPSTFFSKREKKSF